MRRAVAMILLVTLFIQPAGAATSPYITPELVLQIEPDQHLWVKMAKVLVDRLYDPTYRLFRETWGTYEGQRWYWNTEQGEAAQILARLGYTSLLADVFNGYRQYLVYEYGSFVYPFTRFVPDAPAEAKNTTASSFYLRNLIVGIGGDLPATGDRLIKIYLDLYDPNIWYIANMRSWEVWWTQNGQEYYQGIWDKPEFIKDYGIVTGIGEVCAYRVMAVGGLQYRVDMCVQDGKPYIVFKLTVTNTESLGTLSNVMTTIAFDSLDWWQYKYVYIPGKGVMSASGTEQWFYTYGEGGWASFNNRWHFILYTKRPIGMNPAIAVILESPNVDLWCYNTQQKPDYDWYLMWFKIRIHWGDLGPGQSKTTTILIVPMSSFAPGIPDIYDQLLANIGSLSNRDLSFAVNTGTGVFKGFAMAGILLAAIHSGYLDFAINLWNSVRTIFSYWGYNVATRPLANFIIASLILYHATQNYAYVEEAMNAAITLLNAQIRDPSDYRDGGWLDIPPPFGAGTYLDVNAEAAHALLKLYEITLNPSYKEAVDYWLEHWFRYDPVEDRWYYYRFNDPSHPWFLGYLDEKQPYAQGYFLQALAKYIYNDDRIYVSLSRIFELLADEFWELTWDGAAETNVETQSSVAAGLADIVEVMLQRYGAAIEYVRNARIENITYSATSGMSSFKIELGAMPYSYATLVLYMVAPPQAIYINGVKAANVTFDQLSSSKNAYFYNATSKLLYVRLFPSSNTITVELGYEYIPPPVQETTTSSSTSSSQSGGNYTYTPPAISPPQMPPLPWHGWTPSNYTLPLPDWLKDRPGLVAAAIILGMALLANEATAPFFALVATGLLAYFAHIGWISVGDALVSLLFLASGLGIALARKRS
ncbi:MAG TPA: hypothetical protein EYP20_01880 [Aigarchaeota archaeon]|nr:hypothetical protein [Aigarchaeota archaeon]